MDVTHLLKHMKQAIWVWSFRQNIFPGCYPEKTPKIGRAVDIVYKLFWLSYKCVLYFIVGFLYYIWFLLFCLTKRRYGLRSYLVNLLKDVDKLYEWTIIINYTNNISHLYSVTFMNMFRRFINVCTVCLSFIPSVVFI